MARATCSPNVKCLRNVRCAVLGNADQSTGARRGPKRPLMATACAAMKIKALGATVFACLMMVGCAEKYTFPVLSPTRFHSITESADDYESETKTSVIRDPARIARVVGFMNLHRFGWRKLSFWENVAGEGAPYVTVDLYGRSLPNQKADWNFPYLVSTRQTFWRGDAGRRFYLDVSQDDRKQLCAVLSVKCSSDMLAP